VKQVWFAGVHCDVGGGYPEAQSGLSKIALEWMLCEARLAGLLIDDAKENEVLGRVANTKYVAPNAKAEPHESLTWKWYPAEFVPKRHYDYKTKKTSRRMSMFRRRTIPPGSLVHESVMERTSNYKDRLPPDVQEEKTACRALAAGSQEVSETR
jgi:hypothetical protein